MRERLTASSITDDALDELYARLEAAEAAVGRAERFAAELERRLTAELAPRVPRHVRGFERQRGAQPI